MGVKGGGPPSQPLAAYRAKRSGERTPEPMGAEPRKAAPASWSRPRLFCVQKHAARRLHYDFRLELDGVLRSWAVPKGPSLDPAEKRLAMEVEDHPVEYADFEGVIPEGNYGAGEVIVWDKGLWVPTEDPGETLPRGKLSFELHGYKLRGLWHLFRTKGKGEGNKEWMLVKKADGWAGAGRVLPPESIYSGLTLEEIRGGSTRAAELRAELQSLPAPQRRLKPSDIKIMLAETGEKAFSGKEWIFELKYDGFRVLGHVTGGEPRLLYRKGFDATEVFPEIARALRSLPFDGLIVDGEAVVLDEQGRPSFQRLQRRALLKRSTDIARAAVELPATYFVFDLLAFEGFDLRGLPLVTRKRLLKRLLPEAGPVRYLDHIEEEGEAFYREVEKLGLEGIVAKKAASLYRGRRTSDWIKLRVDQVDDFVVVGFTKPDGARTGFGALDLAQFRGGELVYAGRVGSGFDERQLDALQKILESAARPTPPCKGLPQKERGLTFVEPRLVVEVRYKERTRDELLRQPVFLRLRDDKAPEDCVFRPSLAEEEIAAEGSKPAAPPEVDVERRVPFTNLKKVFWPEEGYTKGDLIEYYRRISPWLLPYLRDRLVVLTRYPDGITGKNFFQKDAPGFAPGWLRTERIWSEHASREIDYFVVENVEGLLYIINLGTIPLHIWASRISSLALPDWCILDLDPKGAPFEQVVRVAQEVHAVAEEMGVPSYAKTSGSSGIHVLVPLGGQLTFEQCKSFGELVARIVAERLPEIATTVRLPKNRGGRVYLDFLQNGHGKLLAAPWSARPVKGALVSTPLLWSEVKPGLDIAHFNIESAPPRIEKAPKDPLVDVLREKPDLQRAIARLGDRVGR